jgi:uncharacterized protein DUF3830
MDRWLNVRVDGAEARFRLLEEYTPKSVDALWRSLPIKTEIRHGKLSGQACFLEVHQGPLLQLPPDPELPVTSIYKGYLVLTVHPELGMAELLVSYGTAEYRWPTGRRYVTPVGHAEDGQALFDALARMFTEGAKTVEIEQVTT